METVVSPPGWRKNAAGLSLKNPKRTLFEELPPMRSVKAVIV